MNVDRTKFALGGVRYIDIDGIDYPISSDGCLIEKVADIGITPVVGRPEPRIVERTSHYTVTVSMLENTLEMLRIAWNLPNAVSYGASHDYLYLGISDAPTARTLAVRGWGGLSGNIDDRQWREWYFRKVVSYEPQPQDLGVGNTVFIPVRFYCYADSTQASGEEFGYVQQQKTNLVVNPGMEVDDNWNNWSTPTTNERSSTQVRSGVYSRHCVGDSNDDGLSSDTFTTSANTDYVVTVYVYVDSLSATNVSLYLNPGDDGTKQLVANTTSTGSWIQLKGTVTDEDGGSLARLVVVQVGAGASEFFIDDASVREA